jgi:6-pyruvoyl-tetrahydropterin synthase related domain
MFSNISKQFLLHLAILALLAGAVMSWSFFNGVTSGNDLPQHFQFADTIHKSLITNEFYPSLASNINEGYGDYAIRIYPSLTYYVLSICFIILGSWYYASLLTYFLVFFIGGIGVYLWAKQEFNANQALLAGGLYIFAPYHINEIYNNFLLAEFMASAVIPFCFLFLTRICQKGRLKDILGLAIFYALLILTHLPLTIIGSLIFGVYALMLLKKENIFQTLFKLTAAVFLGIGASSFYWIKVVTEQTWFNHSSKEYFQTIYDYKENFLFTPQNIINFQTDTSCLWLADLMLMAILLLSIPSIIFLFKNRRNLSKFTMALSVIFVFSVFMTTPLSSFVWDNFGFLQKVQFPWRWLSIVSVSGSIFASFGILRASEIMNQSKNLLITFGLGFIFIFFAFTSFFIIKQAVFLPRENFETEIDNIGNLHSFDCWWTIWAKSGALAIKEKAVIEGRNIEIQNWESTRKVIKVSAGQPNLLRIAVFYYPYWQANVNGINVHIFKTDDGAILIPLENEESNVELTFVEPFIVKFFITISFLSWIIIIGLFLINLSRHKSKISD